MSIKNLGATGHAFKDETFEKVASNLKANNIDRIQLTPSKITTEFDWSKNCYTPALANYVKEKLDTFRDKIRLVHLKEMDIIDGKKTIVPVGTGKIDFDYMFKKFDENLCTIDMIVESLNSEYITNGIKILVELCSRFAIEKSLYL